MRVFRSIILFIGAFILADLMIGFAVDAVVLTLFGDLSQKANQALLVVKFLAYVTAAVFLTVKMDETFQKRAAVRPRPDASPTEAGDAATVVSSCETSAPRSENPPGTVAAHAPPPSATASEPTSKPSTSSNTPSSRMPRRVSTPVVVLVALGLVALGVAVGALALRGGDKGPKLATASQEKASPSASPRPSWTASPFSLKGLPKVAKSVLVTTTGLIQHDPSYWRSQKGRAELRQIRKALGPLKSALYLVDLSGDATPRETRLLRATKNHAFALYSLVESLLRGGYTNAQILRLQSTYKKAITEYRRF